MAIYDEDERYLKQLVAYLKRRGGIELEVREFYLYEEMREYVEIHKPELIVIGVRSHRDDFEDSMIINLCEPGQVVHDFQRKVNKYQGGEVVLKEIMEYYYECYQINEKQEHFQTKIKIYGVYSPISRCGKTTFSLGLAEALSKKYQVLFLSFEIYSGLVSLLSIADRSSLSDLLYHCKKKGNEKGAVVDCIYEKSGFHVIPPVRYAQDLFAVTEADIKKCMKCLSNLDTYQVLVIDFANRGGEELDLCNRVFIPEKEDTIAKEKMQEWKCYMRDSGREALFERVNYIQVPKLKIETKDRYLESILWGDIGAYTKEFCIKEVL